MEIVFVELGKFFAGLLSKELVYIVVGTLILTQAGKWGLIYRLQRMPNTLFIWFVLAPAVSMLPAYFTWNTAQAAQIPFWMAGLMASFLANIAYAVLLKKVLGTYAPDVYEKLNFPIERRKEDAAPPASGDRRETPPTDGGTK